MMTDADKVAAVKGRIKALDSVIACLDAEAHMGMELPISGPVL